MLLPTPPTRREEIRYVQGNGAGAGHRMSGAVVPVVMVDSGLITSLYACPICRGKTLNNAQALNHLEDFHRISQEMMIRLNLSIKRVDVTRF